MAKKEEKKKKRYGLGARLLSSTVGGMGASAVGAPITQALSGSLAAGEHGLQTTQADVERLKPHINPNARTYIHPEGGVETALHIPKGGDLPEFVSNTPAGKGFLQQQGAALEHGRGIPGKVVSEGLQHGVSVAPAKAGPHLMAHEMGHGAVRNTAIGKTLAKARAPGVVAGPLGASMMAMSDPDSTTSKLAPVVGAAGIAPTLIDEGAASWKALRAMQRAGYNSTQLRKAQMQLLKGFGTYGATLGAGAIAAPIITRKVLRHFGRPVEPEAQPATKTAESEDMPFKSQAQRGWMYANHPEMAKEWEAHTPKGKKLPERVKQSSVPVHLSAGASFRALGEAHRDKALKEVTHRLLKANEREKEKTSMVHVMLASFSNELSKIAKEMPHFTDQDRPEKVKDVYKALKRDHPNMPAEVKARIAARKGKGSAHARKPPETGGPAYKAPLHYENKGGKYKAAMRGAIKKLKMSMGASCY